MALRKIIEVEGESSIKTEFGIIKIGEQKIGFSAYIKILSFYGDKTKIEANVNFKGDVQSFNKQYQLPVSVEFGSTNFVAQAYNYLKTLPEFAGAVDC